MAKLMTAEEAVKAYIKDGMTIATNGFVGAVQPEGMMRAIQKSFLEEGTPRDLTLVHAAGQGGGADAEGNVVGQVNHLGEEGLLKKIIAGHYSLAPRIQKLVNTLNLHIRHITGIRDHLKKLFLKIHSCRCVQNMRIHNRSHAMLPTDKSFPFQSGKAISDQCPADPHLLSQSQLRRQLSAICIAALSDLMEQPLCNFFRQQIPFTHVLFPS